MDHSLLALIFSDAGRFVEKVLLSFIDGVLVDGLKHCSIFYDLSLTSHHSRIPVKSTGAAEMIAAGEAIHEGETIAFALYTFYSCSIPLWISVYFKDWFSSSTTQCNSITMSIHGGIFVLRYEFETDNISQFI